MPFEARTENQKLTLTRSLTSSVTTQINFCSIFVKTRPGTIKRSFRIENRSSSLADSRGETPPPHRLAGSGTRSEEFVNLQSLLVQSSIWFGVSSVQFSSLFTICLESSFSSVRGMEAKCLHSVRSVQFSSVHKLFRS